MKGWHFDLWAPYMLPFHIVLALSMLTWALPAHGQPVLSSPDGTVTVSAAWLGSEMAMKPYDVPHPRKPWLSHYQLDTGPTRTGPWTTRTFVLVPLFPPRPLLYNARLPGYMPSGRYWIRFRAVSMGGWHARGTSRPVMATLDRGGS